MNEEEECRKFCCTGHRQKEEEEEEEDEEQREPTCTWKKHLKSIMEVRGLEDRGWVNRLLWELKNAVT
jgi:hypothetical protein